MDEIVLPPDTVAQAVDEEEDDIKYYPHKKVFAVHHAQNCRKTGTHVGTMRVGTVETELREMDESAQNLYFVHSSTLNHDGRIVKVHMHVKPEKKSPWKGWKSYDFMRVVCDMNAEDSYILIDELTDSDCSRAGLNFAWYLRGNDIMFNVYCKDIWDAVECANLNAATKIHPERRPNLYGEQSNARVVNEIMIKCFPNQSEVIRGRFPILLDDGSVLKMREDFNKFFLAVKECQSDSRRQGFNYSLSLSSLTSTLRPYQIAAVQFMMNRELNAKLEDMSIMRSMKTCTEGVFYYPALNVFCRREYSEQPISVCGGILADEMGLGKTVELLALIMSLTPSNIDSMVELKPEMKPEMKPLDGPYQQQVSPEREVLDELVSSVVAAVDGATGLKAIKSLQSVNRYDRIQNVVFNLNTYMSRTRSINKGESRISCNECGAVALKNKMHWKDSFTDCGFNFTCPDCVSKETPMKVSTTLIVVPQSILHQWYEEIRRHVKDDVIIDVYNGVQNEGYKHPVYLSHCHIVLVSYETMRREFEFADPVDLTSKLRKRNYAVSKAVTSPLLAVDWWRICLDESQLVESDASNLAAMCHRLSGRARWCVTGTPLVHSVNDLYHLVSFLYIFPFNFKGVWQLHLWNSWRAGKKEPLVELMSQIFWRNTIDDVRDQLGIPPINTNVVEVSFTALEERLYSEKMFDCRNRVRSYLRGFPFDPRLKLSQLPAHILANIMNRLHSLRLSVVTGDSHIKVRPSANDDKDKRKPLPFTPEALFKRLFQKNKTRVEDKTRELVSTYNAIAGLALLLHPAPSTQGVELAMSGYRKVLDMQRGMECLGQSLALPPVPLESDPLNATFKGFKLDNTQLYHALFNLSDISTDPADKDICSKMMPKVWKRHCRRATAEFESALAEWNQTENETWTKTEVEFADCHDWLAQLIDIDIDADRAQKLKTALCEQPEGKVFDELKMAAIGGPIFDWLDRRQGDVVQLRRNMAAFNEEFVIEEKSGSLKRNSTVAAIIACEHNEMFVAASKEEEKEREAAMKKFIEENYGRELRRDAEKKEIADKAKGAWFRRHDCPSCHLRSMILDLEKAIKACDDMERPIPLERDSLYRFCEIIYYNTVDAKSRRIPMHSDSHQSLQSWFKLCRSTVVRAKNVMDSLQSLIGSIRELEQCSSRYAEGMELTLPMARGGFRPAGPALTVKIDVETELGKHTIERAYNDFKSTVGQMRGDVNDCVTRLKYIHTLENSEEGEAPSRECPICYSDIRGQWFVFPCAHVMCYNCFENFKVIEQAARPDFKYLRCVSCRRSCYADTVSLVQAKLPSRPSTPMEMSQVEGIQLTVKFNAIVKKVNDLLKADMSNKLLLFSSMLPAVECLSEVLKLANIPFRRIGNGKNVAAALADFRNDIDVRVLLLPLSCGANGLNLTQANHVLFVEPITDTSVISQAIGRMARMGQHRSMTVHHFVMKGTVEEEILRVVEGGADEAGWTMQTLWDVLGL